MKIILSIFIVLALIPIVLAVPPSINNVTDFPDPVEVNHTITIQANVTDADGDLDSVVLSFLSPVSENYTMVNISNDTFQYNYTPQLIAFYYYEIHANDTQGNETISGIYTFNSTGNITYNFTATTTINISVEVSASCCASIDFYYIPEYVIRGQEAAFILMVENCGNLVENETTTLIIKDPNGTALGDFIPLLWQRQVSNGTLVFDTTVISPRQYIFKFGIWDSDNFSLGNYTATGIVNYISESDEGNATYIWTELNSSANCTEIVNNESYCIEYFSSSCSYLSTGETTNISTTTPSNATVEGMANGSTAYEGNTTLDGDFYHAYVFNMSAYQIYAYMCLSPDENLSSDECGYENDIIHTNNKVYKIEYIQSDGQLVSISPQMEMCSSKGKMYNCTVNEANDTAFCNVTYFCMGSQMVVENFTIIEGLQNVTEPEPTPEPSPTPTPTPEPSPTPEPTPQPGVSEEPGQTQLAIEIEPLEKEVSGQQGDWIAVIFNVTNIGTVDATNITLLPVVMEFWEYKEAHISNLTVGQSVNRTIFVRAPYDAPLGKYVIPVKAIRGNETLDIDYFWLILLEAINKTLIQLLEVPKIISLYPSSNLTVPILIKNIGKIPLHNITGRLENIEQCLEYFEFKEVGVLEVNETNSTEFFITSKSVPMECNATLIVGSIEKAYAFADITIVVSPPPSFLPEIPKIPGLLLVMLALLSILLRIKKKRESMELEPGRVGILINLVSLIIIILLIYILGWYFGFLEMI